MKFNEFEYSRPDLEQVKQSFTDLIEKLIHATSKDEALELIRQIQQVQNDVDTQGTLASVRYSIDTRDEFYEAEISFWDENQPIISDYINQYYRAVLDSPYLEGLKEEIAEPFFKIIEQNLQVFSPDIIPLLQEENKLSTEYSKLIASAAIEYKGETYNLSGLGKFAQSTDRAERQEISRLTSQFFSENLSDLDRIYDELVKLRDKMAKELGFKDFVEMGYARMNRLDYTREDVEIYRQEVLEHVVPLVEEIYQRQSDRLGISELKNYDLNLSFPSGNADPQGTYDEIIGYTESMYHELSPETGEFFDFMVERDLMDLETKPGKQGGGYCTFIPNYESPFIFANFNGTRGDVEVLTHEAGHAFQVYESRWVQEPELIWPTYESCEIHSMSMEFITWPWMELYFKENTEKFKYSHLTGTAIFLPYGVLVDHYQHEVYENPEMTPAERRAKWRELEKLYNPWKDYDGNEFLEEGGYWMRQGHIFGSPFYYIDYTLAQVCALQFWQRSQVHVDDTYWEDYLKICQLGGTQSFTEIVKTANLKLPFEKGSLESVSQSIKEYIDSVDEEVLA